MLFRPCGVVKIDSQDPGVRGVSRRHPPSSARFDTSSIAPRQNHESLLDPSARLSDALALQCTLEWIIPNSCLKQQNGVTFYEHLLSLMLNQMFGAVFWLPGQSFTPLGHVTVSGTHAGTLLLLQLINIEVFHHDPTICVAMCNSLFSS